MSRSRGRIPQANISASLMGHAAMDGGLDSVSRWPLRRRVPDAAR